MAHDRVGEVAHFVLVVIGTAVWQFGHVICSV